MTQTPFSVLLAAGGMGTRMGANTPKQYLNVHHKPLALYSFETFLGLPEVTEIVVVCEAAYEHLFQTDKVKVVFAKPGKRRQDSVLNGIEKLKGDPLVCIHDAARPCITPAVIRRVVATAQEWNAAVVGVPVKATIKICNEQQMIVSTPDRSKLWEVQTPQVIRLNLIREGYQYAQKHHLTVTDDVSLVELLEKPVKIVEGSYSNIKVTTPEDLILVEQLLGKHVLL